MICPFKEYSPSLLLFFIINLEPDNQFVSTMPKVLLIAGLRGFL